MKVVFTGREGMRRPTESVAKARRIMNCDDVFVILTRGPFPSGSAHDGQVEAHLRRCGDCRRLAEALRPSDELMQESIGLEEANALPGYWGNSLPAVSDLAVSLSERSLGPADATRSR